MINMSATRLARSIAVSEKMAGDIEELRGVVKVLVDKAEALEGEVRELRERVRKLETRA